MNRITHILLVEENPQVVHHFETILDKTVGARYVFSYAMNLADAAVIMSESKPNREIDVVVLNLKLSSLSGLDTLHKCKDLLPKVPIIALLESDDEHLAMRAIQSGARSFLVKDALNSQTVMRKIHYAIERNALWTEMVEAEKREYYLATRDPLTGLPNRHSVMETIQQLVVQSERRKENFAVIFIEIDRFKSISELVSQRLGDVILLEISKRLQSCVRETDIVARLSKSEFVLILSNLQTQQDAARVCNKVIKHFSAPIKYQEKKLNIACHLGIALYPQDAKSYDTLINHADAALQFSKMGGRNTYKFFTRELTYEVTSQLNFENNLEKAIEKGSLKLVYQPIYTAGSQHLSGIEALVRWPQEDGSLLPPIDFIPIAEKLGLSVVLGEFIVKEACKQAKEWFSAGFPPVKMAVNISENFFSRHDFSEKISAILKETGCDPQYLLLEITENTLMKASNSAKITLEKLKNLGVHVSIDDFGIGHSSLSNLHRLPIDTVKIDKSIVQKSNEGKKELALVEAIVSFAKHMDLNVVAEGIETLQQCNVMEKLGCDQLQGFYFSYPMDADKIESLYT